MAERSRTVLQSGRAKAYRPMPVALRRAALEAGLRAYAEADYFLAHELLEPPWMGTRDLAERELIQGVIKLAAAFVHGARSNPKGIDKNLRGARDRVAKGALAGPRLGIDVTGLLTAIDDWLADPRTDAASVLEGIPIPRLTASGARANTRAPVGGRGAGPG